MQPRALQDLIDRTRAWAESRSHLFADPTAYLAGVEDAIQRLCAGVLADGVPEHPAARSLVDGPRSADALDADRFDAAVARLTVQAATLAGTGEDHGRAVADLRRAGGGDPALLLAAHRSCPRPLTAGVPDPGTLLLAAASDSAGGEPADRHRVTFYERTSQLVGEVADFVAPALTGVRGRGLVVARPTQRQQVVTRLHARGVDVASACSSGRYVALDAAATLRTLLRDDRPDRWRFREAVRPDLEAAAEDGEPARVYGEMVALLWDDGKVDAALELEELWNELALEVPFTVLCGYPVRVFDPPHDAGALRAVCHHHSSVVATAG